MESFATTNKELKSKRELRENLEERLVGFSVRVLKMSEEIQETKGGNHIAGQFIRCGTSPAFNYGEAQSAESRADFIHKMKVCLKELRETFVCLKIVHLKPLIALNKLPQVEELMKENDELISIFVKSINTATSQKSIS